MAGSEEAITLHNLTSREFNDYQAKGPRLLLDDVINKLFINWEQVAMAFPFTQCSITQCPVGAKVWEKEKKAHDARMEFERNESDK
jgi:hypothetical protein